MANVTRREFVSASSAFLSAAALRRPIWAQAAAQNLTAAFAPLLLGVDYYPDQTPESLWEEDARKIAEAGLTNVRIAEFAWALMEPSEGNFDFGWLQRAVDVLHGNHIGVILGTPSAAPPPWLTAKYADVMEVDAQGLRLHPGGRRFTCPTNPTYRRLSLAIATEMAKKFAEHPAVIGWQIDNELTLGSSPRCYCSYCRAGFQAWLRSKYGTLEKLNETWGTNFWSQHYTDWVQIPVPLPSGADPNPGLALDYGRFQSYANASFLNEQLTMLRQLCPRHFVTTNNIGVPYDEIDDRELYAKLDFVAFDNYPGFIEMLMAQNPQPGPVADGAVPATVAIQHDFGRSILKKPFFIMEEQVGKAGQSTFSPQPQKGQVRLWSYQAVAHGAMGINYFRWDTATFGAEEYWHGMLNHDRSKSPAFDEILQTVKELKALGPELLHSKYEAECALYFDYDCSWAIKIQPGHFRLNYVQQSTSWYRAISPSHTGIDIIGPGADLSGYKVVFAPVLYVLSRAQADRIREYVRAGGVFVTGFRLGVKTENSQIVRMPLPGLLADVMGTTVEDYVPIYSQPPHVKFSSVLEGPEAECGIWADILKPDGAAVLGRYSTGEHAGKAAITMNSFGKGKAIYIGADLNPPTLAKVLRALSATANVRPPIAVPNGVELTKRFSGDRQWIFLLNHTAEAQKLTLPGNFKDLITGETLSSESQLSAYGVRVLQPA